MYACTHLQTCNKMKSQSPKGGERTSGHQDIYIVFVFVFIFISMHLHVWIYLYLWTLILVSIFWCSDPIVVSQDWIAQANKQTNIHTYIHTYYLFIYLFYWPHQKLQNTGYVTIIHMVQQNSKTILTIHNNQINIEKHIY